MKKIGLIILAAAVAFVAVSAGMEWYGCRVAANIYATRSGDPTRQLEIWNGIVQQCSVNPLVMTDYLGFGLVINPLDWLVDRVVGLYETVLSSFERTIN